MIPGGQRGKHLYASKMLLGGLAVRFSFETSRERHLHLFYEHQYVALVLNISTQTMRTWSEGQALVRSAMAVDRAAL